MHGQIDLRKKSVNPQPYTLCNSYECHGRWEVDICDSKGYTEAIIKADTQEEAERRGAWLLKCMNEHAHIFQN